MMEWPNVNSGNPAGVNVASIREKSLQIIDLW